MEIRSSTKIICTIGPATSSKEKIKGLLQKGMSIARINLSHCNLELHETIILNIREIEYETNYKIFIAFDTRGQEDRIQCKNTIKINKNEFLKIISNKTIEMEENNVVSVNYENLDFVQVNDIITFDDSKLKVKVEEANKGFLICKALNTYKLSNNKRIYFPTKLHKSGLINPKDIQDIEIGINKNIDMVFLSFIENKKQIEEYRKIISNTNIQLIAKIETQEAINNIDDILKGADGIMIARGDLLNDIGIDKMFSTQKLLIEKCNKQPVIMATEMLSSMVCNISPLRCEISDVGNAVLDNCSAVMLSEETSMGKHPFEVVDTMRKICIDAERYLECKTINKVVFKKLDIKNTNYKSQALQKGMYFKF